MAFIDSVIERAQRDPKTIVLPEPEDERTLHAAVEIQAKGIARVILVGNEDEIAAKCRELGIECTAEIVNPEKAEWTDEFAAKFTEMRKAKGMTLDKAQAIMRQPIPHGVMMLQKGKGDGLVAGAIHSTGDTLRPALQILKTAPGCPIVSSFFFMTCAPETPAETTYLFADCGLIEEPTAEQLAEIALSTAQSAIAFGFEPYVAMLSYSTKGSASSGSVDKVIEATRLAQERAKERFDSSDDVCIDGELQVDAAVVAKVGSSKAPGSPVAGKARVLIFPDLSAGNIAYKAVQRLGGADAYGPIIQGMRMPVNDLSRGCTAEDILGVAAVTVVQAQMMKSAGG